MRLRVKKVRCIETSEVFESVGAAAEHAGVKISTMSRHLSGQSFTCGKAKYHYEFVEDKFNYNAKMLRGEISIEEYKELTATIK